MKSSKSLLRFTASQKQKLTLMNVVVCSLVMIAAAGALFFYFNIGRSYVAKATPTSPVFVFKNPTVQSGTAGTENCVYKFANVLTGVDALVTIADIYNSASVSNVDIPQSTTGYEDAFQPYVSFKNGSAASPATSYIEWYFQFKKAGTTADTILPAVSVTAIDIDGNSVIVESVDANRPTSFSTYSTTQLGVTQNATTLTAVGPSSDFSGIDSSNQQVMFQMNFYNIKEFSYRTVGINKSSAVARQFSIYFKTFFYVSPLPVELMKFTATRSERNTVNLTWTTASELNNNYFTIEKSNDGVVYTNTGSLPGSGTVHVQKTYSFTDHDAPTGNIYYRLSQTDFDGKTETFKPIVVKPTDEAFDFKINSIYPNPFSESLKINYTIDKGSSLKFTIINSTGQLIKSWNEDANKGSNVITISNLERLPPGQYIVSVTERDKQLDSKRIIKK